MTVASRILFIVADDLGYGDLHPHHAWLRKPALDALAASSTSRGRRRSSRSPRSASSSSSRASFRVSCAGCGCVRGAAAAG
jgi:arylsulfatase A-like enzyme